MKKLLAFILVLALVGSALGYFFISTQDGNQGGDQEDNENSQVQPPDENATDEENATSDDETDYVWDGAYHVTYIVDGDTIEIGTGERVRLIGIDTPESYEPYYDEATEKLAELIGGNTVRLESDVTDKDMYGRLLKYVWIGDLHVNLEMVRSGYAMAYPYEPDTKYASQFEAAEIEARSAGLGIWATEETGVYVVYVHYDASGDDRYNLNDEYIIIKNNGNATVSLTEWTITDVANHRYTFLSFTLSAGASVTLYTGSGTDSATAVYWGSGAPIWNNDHDTVYLRDADGVLVYTCEY